MAEIDVATIAPLSHAEAMRLQGVELDRAVALLRALDAGAWTRPTDCPDWDVRRLYLHVLGACEAGASVRENAHQLRTAMAHRKREGGPLEAALSSVQVREREHLSPPELVDRLAAVAPRTIKGRKRLPAALRKVARIPVDGPIAETWTLGYLVDTIYLRDLWMHRIDASRAVDRPFEITAEHDGRIIADVVREWARRHGRPFVVELTGPAGATYGHDAGDTACERLTLDAVEFGRTLAGRTTGTGLLATIVPF